MTVLVLTDRRADAAAALAAADLADSVIEPTTAGALERLSSGTGELVILDAGTPGEDVLALVQPLTAAGRPVVVAAAQPTLATSLRALKAGALDVIAFPPPPQRLRELVTDLAGRPSTTAAEGAAGGWIGSSDALREAFLAAVKLGASGVPVLIAGEAGTGRERLARVVHDASPRADGPWLVVNCGAIPEAVLESELFGHERGGVPGVFGRRVGRFVRAAGGTIYLAELDRLALRLQQRIAQMLVSGMIKARGAALPTGVDVRLIAGVTADARQMERQNVLLPELAALLAPGMIELPPLRARGDADLELLVQHFVAEQSSSLGRAPVAIGEDAWEVLRRYSWPGNVRQLKAAVDRAVLHAEAGVVHARHLPRDVTAAVDEQAAEQSLLLDDVEKRHIMRVLEITENHVGRAAELMGIHRNTLTRKLRTYGIEIDRD